LAAFEEQPDSQLWQQVYRALGNATVAISADQGQASAESLKTIESLLQTKPDDH
jgi:hypothetical protein